jgi:hypothetical protein
MENSLVVLHLQLKQGRLLVDKTLYIIFLTDHIHVYKSLIAICRKR